MWQLARASQVNNNRHLDLHFVVESVSVCTGRLNIWFLGRCLRVIVNMYTNTYTYTKTSTNTNTFTNTGLVSEGNREGAG